MPRPLRPFPLAVTTLFLLVALMLVTSLHPATPHHRLLSSLSPFSTPRPHTNSRTLGFKRIDVVHLPARKDRRARMIELGEGLGGLGWTFVDAVSKDGREVEMVEGWTAERERVVEDILLTAHAAGEGKAKAEGAGAALSVVQALFPDPPPATNADSWSVVSYPTAPNETFVSPFLNHHLSPTILRSLTAMKPLPWTSSRGMIACWYSHHEIIKRFAAETTEGSGSDTGGREKALLILEDDVDMERGVESILDGVLLGGSGGGVGEGVPADWDILYLGYCASKSEHLTHPHAYATYSSPASSSSPFSSSSPSRTWSLHRSSAPLCTHAYALSPSGARKLVKLLNADMFAYLVAYDEALVFLSRSNLLNAYSIYPSLVGQLEDGGISDVQRGGKKDENEVEEDEKLVDPVLGRS